MNDWIAKSVADLRIAPNLREYESSRRSFSWAQARAELDGLPEGRGLNIAHEAVDRHAAGPLRDKVAIRWLGRDGAIEEYSFAQLSRLSNQFANVLAELGVAPGERVYALTGRIPALYIAALGSWKYRAVFCTAAIMIDAGQHPSTAFM
jgi:acetyl-CoA synthetase